MHTLDEFIPQIYKESNRFRFITYKRKRETNNIESQIE